MKKAIILISLLVLFSSLVFGAYVITPTEPGEYTIQNSTTVTFGVNATGDNHSFNCSVYLKTARTDNLTFNTSFTVANATVNTTTITFDDGDRVWWKMGCFDIIGATNVINETPTIPGALAQVDLDYDDDGVIDVSVWVNYTQLVEDETTTTPAENATVQLNQSDSHNYNEIESVISAKAYNGSVNITMIEGIDYSLGGHIVYMNSSTYEGNTSYWDYEFYNSTVLNEDTDFNLSSDEMVYMMLGQYAGDDSLWNYSYPGQNNVNEVNTSVRIFDVDEWYWDYLNIDISINVTGDIIASGNITADGYKIGDYVGLTGNYTINASTCWIKFNGGLATSTNCTAT